MTTPTTPPPVSDAILSSLREMSDTTAVKGGLLRDIIDQLATARASIEALTEALEESLAEREALRGIQPELPPPPFVDSVGGMPRYGLRWNGPSTPLATPMSDGYWTPWHLASAAVEALRANDARRHAAESELFPMLRDDGSVP